LERQSLSIFEGNFSKKRGMRINKSKWVDNGGKFESEYKKRL
jgi:hypothetical protein